MSTTPTLFNSPKPVARKAPRSGGLREQEFQALIEDHLSLVRSIVEQMKRKLPQNLEAEELFSVGITGLVAAAHNYRPSELSSFAGYAATRIRGAILDELRRLDWMSRASRSKAKRLGSALSRLEQEQGGTVAPEALCAELQMTEEELQDLQAQMRPVRMVSLDGPEEGDDTERSLHDVIADDFSASANEVLERKELVALLAERIAQLPEMPRKVLAMYYYENLRQADIAAYFGLTGSRICQIHTRAIKQLRIYLQGILT